MHLDGYAFIVRQRANCSSRDTMAPETGQDFVIQTDREYRIVMVRYSLVALRQQFISQQHRFHHADRQTGDDNFTLSYYYHYLKIKVKFEFQDDSHLSENSGLNANCSWFKSG
ncbi:hypothetical protein HZH68_009029 [Vespula germanica]|uniref:Uncharacterized protein n=1 Tax=Vespula germanica TaxID=30212 RepID=A0A834K0F7_VESGE|nr:hypothetical protein HZH68_009029 [Vespula germanica]